MSLKYTRNIEGKLYFYFDGGLIRESDVVKKFNQLEQKLKIATSALESMLDDDQFPQEAYYAVMFVSTARESLEKIRKIV